MLGEGDNFKQRGFAAIMVVVVMAVLTAVIANYYIKHVIPQPGLVKTLSINSNIANISKPKESSDSSKLQKDNLVKYLTVEAALLGVSDNISLYFQDLSQDVNVSIAPSKSWIPASTIKSFVALEAFRQRRAGTIDFNQTVTIQDENVVPTELETDEFPRLRSGVSVTVKQLVDAMITQSDNTAYNTLLDILDRRSINNYLKNLGLTETVVGEKLNLDDNQFQTDLAAPGRQPNTTTVKDFAVMFEMLYNNKIPDSSEILAIFKMQKINNMIPFLLPSGTIVAHKTGDWAPIYHDGGIVYKPDDPFILTVFTNSNDPTVLAKLAKVAYFQTADTVGQELSINQPSNIKTGQSQAEYTLADSGQANQVLGVTIQDVKFPDITAADLGITADDLSLNKGISKNIPAALITPGSFLYGAKLTLENLQFSVAQQFNQGTNANLDQARNRLSEVRAIAKQGDLQQVSQLLNQSENNLSQAADLAAKNNKSNLDLIQTKQVNDLQFATLADIAPSIDPSKKEQFVDIVYNLYQKNQQQVIPKVQNSTPTNSLSQKPIIATVENINGNNMTIKLDDGTTKQVMTNSTTPVRTFNQTDIKDPSSITEGTKIAFIGQSTPDGNIVPQFILNNIPKELPAVHTGVILDTNSQTNTLTIQDQFGQKTSVQISDNTVLKARDTTVSVNGIKAGSVVSIFGQIENNSQLTTTPSLSVTASPSITPSTPTSATGQPSIPANPLVSITISQSPSAQNQKPNLTLSPTSIIQPTISGSQPTLSSQPTKSTSTVTPSKTSGGPTTQPTKAPSSTSQPINNIPVIKAVTVTVIQNNSGAKEVKTSKSQPTSSSKPSSPPPVAPPPSSNSITGGSTTSKKK